MDVYRKKAWIGVLRIHGFETTTRTRPAVRERLEQLTYVLAVRLLCVRWRCEQCQCKPNSQTEFRDPHDSNKANHAAPGNGRALRCVYGRHLAIGPKQSLATIAFEHAVRRELPGVAVHPPQNRA